MNIVRHVIIKKQTEILNDLFVARNKLKTLKSEVFCIERDIKLLEMYLEDINKFLPAEFIKYEDS